MKTDICKIIADYENLKGMRDEERVTEYCEDLNFYVFKIDALNVIVAENRTLFFNKFFSIFTFIGNFFFLFAVCLVEFFIILFKFKNKKMSIYVLVVFIITSLINVFFKNIIKAVYSTLKGVGKWTAEMMLTFSMARPDVLSYGDLAIRRGVMRLYGLETLSEKEFHDLTDKFAPYRTTAAFYFWRLAAPDCDFIIED